MLLNQGERKRVARVVMVCASALGLLGLGGADAAAVSAPLLQLTTTVDEVEVVRFGEGGWIDLSGLGMWVDAPNRQFEIRARRAYGQPMSLELITRSTSGVEVTPLPSSLAGNDFSALANFFGIEVTNRRGRVVLDSAAGFCPNAWEANRINPSGPAESTYPQECSQSTWTKGMVYGINRGWSVPTMSNFDGSSPLDIADGHYRLRMWIRRPWRDALHLPWRTSQATIGVTIRTERFECPPFCEGDGPRARPGLRTTNSTSSHVAPSRRVRYAALDQSTLPDLASVPAWQMSTAGENGHDYLNFAADVWNAGPAPLVVEGFRRRGETVMDAHQFFYRNGKPVDSRLVGEMEYHDGGGHDHWHFRDFAKYELTRADKTTIERSGKEAFCLAPTDAIDLTLRGAEYRPGDTGLGTACGGITARWIREVLPAGWGDTYGQYLAGQAFDITDLPNGTYYVKVVANPDGRLIERRSDNNVSFRRVILRGTPGARTVTVPPYRGIDTEGGGDQGGGGGVTRP